MSATHGDTVVHAAGDFQVPAARATRAERAGRALMILAALALAACAGPAASPAGGGSEPPRPCSLGWYWNGSRCAEIEPQMR
jgi:hypothetical protein